MGSPPTNLRLRLKPKNPPSILPHTKANKTLSSYSKVIQETSENEQEKKKRDYVLCDCTLEGNDCRHLFQNLVVYDKHSFLNHLPHRYMNAFGVETLIDWDSLGNGKGTQSWSDYWKSWTRINV